MDKSSTTLLILMLLASSSAVLTLFGIYMSNQPQLHTICLYLFSHPILALNLLILLIIVSSRCFAISRNNYSIDQLPLPCDSPPQRICPTTSQDASARVAEARTSKTKKIGMPESTLKATKEGSQLRQLITTEDSIRPPEMLTQRRNDEVTSSASSSLSSAKLRKQVSLTKEEVNRRLERFIRKFSDD